MREILFRGKRLDNGEWVNGYCCKFGPVGQEKHYIIPEYASALYAFEVDPATVDQYTGLQDKNGKRIFEGDIWNCKGYIGLIIWCKEESRFEAVYEIGGMQFENAVSDIRAKTVEVIGNIHDNPELMKKEDK